MTAESEEDFNTDKAAIRQNDLLEEIARTTQKSKAFVRNGIDTLGIKLELENVEKMYATAVDGVFVNTGTAQTDRNLTATKHILNVLLKKVAFRKEQMDKYQKDLFRFRYQFDSLSGDPVLFRFPSDSAAAATYLKKMVAMAMSLSPSDSVLKNAIDNAQGLQSALNLKMYELESSVEEVEGFQKNLSDRTFNREFANIWEPTGYSRPFSEILSFSATKAAIILWFYTGSNIARVLFLLLLMVVAAVYLKTLKKTYAEQGLLVANFDGQLILRYPIFSAVIIVINIFQFIFPNPPFVFNAVLWTVSSVFLTLVFRKYIAAYWMKGWLAMFVLFLVVCADNLILQASRTERWLMLFMALFGAVAGTYILVRDHRKELHEKWFLYSVGLMVVLETASLIANVFGRYNLSKTLLTSGFFNVVIAVMFLWTVRLINEGLSLAFKIYIEPDKKMFYINFHKVGNTAPPFLYVFMVFGWFILFGRNFYAYKFLSDPIKRFLTDERTIGNYTFSINNLLAFVLIMMVSVVISKIVSFFASDHSRGTNTSGKEEKAGIGSWLLLIRISIIVIGLLLAFAAAGIAMDKITLIISALGVGIGFGLQTIVNNLVSGLIIAFEKPVNVGDFVEISGQKGTMKSIGFRSSVIANVEGADVVMPNGDLLNEHLVNWTLGGGKKRINISVGVAFDTELEKVKELVLTILKADERIMHFPAPQVYYNEFQDSAINIQIYFWVRQLRDASGTRSDTVLAINNVFKEKGIVLPFPQEEIYLHNTKDKEKE